MIEWVNLHRHSMSSLYDGFGRYEDAAEYAQKTGQKALGLTDHGNVSGLADHYRACKDAGIKPILGVEIYFQLEFEPKAKKFHLILLVKNIKGYKNLMKMISEANIKNFFRVPIVDSATLQKYSEGLICMSACTSGLIPTLINNKAEHEFIIKVVKYFKRIFGDDFYFEVIPVKFEPQYKINESIIKLGKETKIGVVLTFDSFFSFGALLNINSLSITGGSSPVSRYFFFSFNSPKKASFVLLPIAPIFFTSLQHSTGVVCPPLDM